MRRVMWTVVVVVALVAAGCGGGDDESSGSKTTTAVTDAPADSGSGGSSGGVATASKKCRDAAVAYGKAVTSASQALTGEATDFEKSSSEFKSFADDAPSEIRDDMKTVAEGYADYIKELKDSGFDASSGKAPSAAAIAKLQAASEKFQASDFQAAAQRVSSWFTKECGS